MSEAKDAARSWVEIDEKRLGENYRVVCEAAGADIEVLSVVKANAYGHGLERCAVALANARGMSHTGSRWFGVADVAEGTRLRKALTDARCEGVRVLVLGGVFEEEALRIAEAALTPVVWTREQVRWLAALRGRAGAIVRVHVEIETGMGRQGVRPGADLEALLRAIASAGLELDGICTHFSSAEIMGSERTREQRRRFAEAVAQAREMGRGLGLRVRWVHAGSSSSVDLGEDAAGLQGLASTMGARAMVRSGIALYGYCLPATREQSAGPAADPAESKIRAKLKPVMTWKTRVLDVRDVAAGEAIGYSATYTAKRPMRAALLPVGYADGLRRELSGTDESAGGWVMMRGSGGTMRRAAIVGRVSMNLTTIDVTEIDGLRVGDEVILLGDAVTADDHARIAQTISYEILCGIRT